MNPYVNLEPVDFDPFSGPEIERIIFSIEPQMEIWASCMLGGKEANCAYIESVSLVFKGEFNFPAFASALHDLIKRHEALRSVFNSDGSKMYVYKDLQPDLFFEDITGKNPEDQQKYILEFGKTNATTEFDLFNGPLIRTALFKLSGEAYHFVLSAHHIICDGWSIGILMQDLGKLYSSYATNAIPSLPSSYHLSQYSAEQAAYVNTEAYKENEQYWIDQFENKIPLLDLPTDFPRPLRRTYKSNRQDFAVDVNLISSIKQIGARAGCSFVTTLMAAFEVFLYRITNQEEIVIGIPAAGQAATGNYSLVGHCVNLLPVRSYPNGNFSFIGYLKSRKSKILNDYDHQQFTFGSLLSKLNITRDPSRIPLVPVVFNIDIGLDDDVRFHGLEHKLISNPRAYESFEIFLNVTGSKETFVLEWSYNTQLFKDSSIAYMMEEFEFLLQCVTNEPELEIKDIPVLIKQIVVPVISPDYPGDKTITDLFSEQVAKTPHNTAIVFANKSITYRELDERSNQVARYLQKRGVKQEMIVPLCIERSIEMLVAIIGILKTGGAYLPIDPAYPSERIKYMLDDSKSDIVISSESCFNQLPVTKNKLIVLEKEWLSINKESTQAVSSIIHPRNLAYVMYTSGSTGKPKGVMIEHGNVVSLVNDAGYVSLTSDDVLLSTGSPSFDATTFEYWGMLLNGGKLVLCDAQTFVNNTLLKDEIAKHSVTMMWFTTSLFNQLVNIDSSVFEGLKTILVGGEKLSEKHIDRIRKEYPAIVIINGYGPTENTTFSLTYRICETEIVNTIPIGKSLNNRFAYVLDEYHRICPAGVAGELYVGGAGLGRGYLNRPELTKERFLQDPFSNLFSGKIYKTGDLVRRLADGNIEYIGRTDDQVKIRGYRIELPEIETVLHLCPAVKDCVVVVNEDNNGEKRLVAYIVPEGRFNKEIIKNYLHKKLPEYMIPGILVELDKIPLTTNGKADRKALPKPELVQCHDENKYIAPSTEFQKIVAEVWTNLLGRKQISITDDFFELGGHSLLALKAMLFIERKTGKRLPLAMLLENSTIEKLSSVIERHNEKIKWDSFVSIKPSGNKTPIYFIHGAGLNVLTFRSISKHLDAEQPVFGLQAKGLNGKEEPLSRMEDIAAHYIGEILKHNPQGPYALAGYSFGGLIAYEMAKQLKEMGKEVVLLALFDTYAEQSNYYDPWSKKIPAAIKTFFAKVWCTIELMKDDPLFIINYRIKSFRKKTLAFIDEMNLFKEANGKDNFYIYSKKIISKLFIAARDYKLTPYNGKIDLFRARRKTYYLPDFEYLGWKGLALGGITIHNVPGEHAEMFNHPNVEELAKILQSSLDKAGKKDNQKKGINTFLKVIAYASSMCEMVL